MKTEMASSYGTVSRLIPVAFILLFAAICINPVVADPLPNNRYIFINVANDAGVKFDLDGAVFSDPADPQSNVYYIKADGGGLNQLHVTTSVSEAYGQVTTTDAQSGTFYLTTTGGRGYNDEIILLVSVRDPIPDDFAVHIKSSGYAWTPLSTGLGTDIAYVDGGVDETFTKADFIYGPQTWKPGPGTLGDMSMPLYFGQDVTDLLTKSYLMFVDLNVANKNSGDIDNGAVKVEYSFTNLDTSAAFNVYAWTLGGNNGQGISWTNRVVSTGSSGWYIEGVERIPAPEFPTMALPVAMIIGILGAVLFVQRTKEH